MNDRGEKVMIGGKEYELLLTTRATKEIAKKYGGMEKLGDKILQSKNYSEALEEIVWLITLLANQPIAIHNFRNPADRIPPLSEEEVELMTMPAELADYRDAITAAILKGTKRDIESEANPKNARNG